jgi:hypothetical protein
MFGLGWIEMLIFGIFALIFGGGLLALGIVFGLFLHRSERNSPADRDSEAGPQ